MQDIEKKRILEDQLRFGQEGLFFTNDFRKS